MSRRFLVLLAGCSLTASPAWADAPGLIVKGGETWVFHLENGQPAGAHLVSADAKLAPGELMVSVKAENGTMMTVTNNTDKFLNYHAAMVAGAREKPTSVCTLMSNGRMGFENWPYSIPAIRLSDFEPAAENTMACK
jgi:hypothetical protein